MREGWKTMKLDDACFVDYGTRVVRKKDGGTIFPVYGGGGATFQMDIYNRENCLVVARFAMSQTCTRFVQGKFFLNDSGLTLRAKDKDLSQQFLDWIIISKNDLIYSFGKGSAQKNLDMEDFRNMEISFPVSLPEQQRIVDILDREFAKIDALKANAEKSLQAAKDLFQATLKKELEPKEGWKKITLKDIAIVRVGPFGSSLHKNDYISGGTPLVNPIHMKDGQVVPAVDFSVNQEKLNELRSYVLKEGDVVFARRGEIGRCALITDKEDGYLCGTGSLFVRFLRKTNSKFMMALFNSPFVKEQLLSKATGATMLNINSTSVENLELNMPTDKEQESIMSCIDDLNNRSITLQENYQKTLTLCDDLKQSLLRKAFNGEL